MYIDSWNTQGLKHPGHIDANLFDTSDAAKTAKILGTRVSLDLPDIIMLQEAGNLISDTAIDSGYLTSHNTTYYETSFELKGKHYFGFYCPFRDFSRCSMLIAFDTAIWNLKTNFNIIVPNNDVRPCQCLHLIHKGTNLGLIASNIHLPSGQPTFASLVLKYFVSQLNNIFYNIDIPIVIGGDFNIDKPGLPDTLGHSFRFISPSSPTQRSGGILDHFLVNEYIPSSADIAFNSQVQDGDGSSDHALIRLHIH